MRADNPAGRPRKYATDADRQAAYRARLEESGTVTVPTIIKRETAETLERICEQTNRRRVDLLNELIVFALLNRDWFNLPRFVKPLREAGKDDRRRATKFRKADDGDENAD